MIFYIFHRHRVCLVDHVDLICILYKWSKGLGSSLVPPGGSDSKAFACNAGDPGSIPGSGRSPGEGNGNPLQHSCLENPMDRGA